jgi:hypothetical protein
MGNANKGRKVTTGDKLRLIRILDKPKPYGGDYKSQEYKNRYLNLNTGSEDFAESKEQAKTYLDAELAKYKTWEEFNLNKNINVNLFASGRQFEQCKKQGVGQTTILKFLNGGTTDSRISRFFMNFLSRQTLDNKGSTK